MSTPKYCNDFEIIELENKHHKLVLKYTQEPGLYEQIIESVVLDMNTLCRLRIELMEVR